MNGYEKGYKSNPSQEVQPVRRKCESQRQAAARTNQYVENHEVVPLWSEDAAVSSESL